VKNSFKFIYSAGKGDLVGCDISLNLIHNGTQLGNVGTGGQDCILKSSSDVKVGHSNYSLGIFRLSSHIH
jgi:hypothetical protein